MKALTQTLNAMRGGVALNNAMHGRLLREPDFKDIYTMPTAGDSGTSIGLAKHPSTVINGIVMTSGRREAIQHF